MTKRKGAGSRERGATFGSAAGGRFGQPVPPASRGARVLAAMIVILQAACHDGDRREAQELCVSASDFSADHVCGTPDDVLRLHRRRFSCSSTDSSCRLENVRGPFPREVGGQLCCYTYTVVRIDNNSYVD